MVPTCLTRMEGDWYLHHSTGSQNIWLEVHDEESCVFELALDTEESEADYSVGLKPGFTHSNLLTYKHKQIPYTSPNVGGFHLSYLNISDTWKKKRLKQT